MGFSSFLDAKKGSTIPAFPWAECPLKESEVVLVLPDNTTVEGVYDGYCRINNQRIFDILAPYALGKDCTEEDVFNNIKFITFPDGTELTIKQFNYDEKLASLNGKSLNEIRSLGAVITTNYDKLEKLIKIVKKYNYKGESFNELKTSDSCPYQGFFYPGRISFKKDLRGAKRW